MARGAYSHECLRGVQQGGAWRQHLSFFGKSGTYFCTGASRSTWPRRSRKKSDPPKRPR